MTRRKRNVSVRKAKEQNAKELDYNELWDDNREEYIENWQERW
jgi:hypothetical protein